MPERNGISKWQEKSIRLNQIRWELEGVLNENLSPEEKQSDKYQELVDSLASTFKHVVPKLRGKGIWGKWKMALLVSLAGSGGAIILKVLELLSNWLIITNGKGSPE